MISFPLLFGALVASPLYIQIGAGALAVTATVGGGLLLSKGYHRFRAWLKEDVPNIESVPDQSVPVEEPVVPTDSPVSSEKIKGRKRLKRVLIEPVIKTEYRLKELDKLNQSHPPIELRAICEEILCTPIKAEPSKVALEPEAETLEITKWEKQYFSIREPKDIELSLIPLNQSMPENQSRVESYSEQPAPLIAVSLSELILEKTNMPSEKPNSNPTTPIMALGVPNKTEPSVHQKQFLVNFGILNKAFINMMQSHVPKVKPKLKRSLAVVKANGLQKRVERGIAKKQSAKHRTGTRLSVTALDPAVYAMLRTQKQDMGALIKPLIFRNLEQRFKGFWTSASLAAQVRGAVSLFKK